MQFLRRGQEICRPAQTSPPARAPILTHPRARPEHRSRHARHPRRDRPRDLPAHAGWCGVRLEHRSVDQPRDPRPLCRARRQRPAHRRLRSPAGRSEHIIGQWLASRQARDDMVVAVKVGAHADNPGLGPGQSGACRRGIAHATGHRPHRRAVSRRDARHIRPSGRDPRHGRMADRFGQGTAPGCLGFAPERLVEARILASAGYPRFTVLDAPYNVVHRSAFEGDLRLVAGAQGIAVTPSHPLEHGFLSGRHRSRDRVGLSAAR